MFELVTVIAAALGCGLIAGVFFAFSSFVMPALARLSPDEGMRAMQSINVVVLNRSFLGVFFGTAVLSLVVGVTAALEASSPSALCRMAAAALYLAGTFGVTAARNVPLNDALKAIPAADEKAPRVWEDYLRDWTRWNHVRTVAALLALLGHAVALTA